MISAILAALCAIFVIISQREQGNAWLHNLLSYSDHAPLPPNSTVAGAIILGYALHKDSSLTEPLKSRVQAGVRLYEQGQVAALVFSGSVPHGRARNRTEADVMQDFAIRLAGLEKPPASGWFVEGESRNTYQNAAFSSAIVCKQGWTNIAIVTSPFHQLRSYLTFKKVLSGMECGAHVQVYVAKMPFAHHLGYGPLLDDWMDLWDFLREVGAMAKYRLMGYV